MSATLSNEIDLSFIKKNIEEENFIEAHSALCRIYSGAKALDDILKKNILELFFDLDEKIYGRQKNVDHFFDYTSLPYELISKSFIFSIFKTNPDIFYNSLKNLELLSSSYFDEGELEKSKLIFEIYFQIVVEKKRQFRLKELEEKHPEYFNWVKQFVELGEFEDFNNLVINRVKSYYDQDKIYQRIGLIEGKTYFERSRQIFYSLNNQKEGVNVVKSLILDLILFPENFEIFLLAFLVGLDYQNRDLSETVVQILEKKFPKEMRKSGLELKKLKFLVKSLSKRVRPNEKGKQSTNTNKVSEGTLTKIARGEDLLAYLSELRKNKGATKEKGKENSDSVKTDPPAVQAIENPGIDSALYKLYESKVELPAEELNVLRVIFKDLQVGGVESCHLEWRDALAIFYFFEAWAYGIRFIEETLKGHNNNPEIFYMYCEFLLKAGRFGDLIEKIDIFLDSVSVQKDMFTLLLYLKAEGLFGLKIYRSAYSIYKDIEKESGAYRLVRQRLFAIENI